MRSKYSDSVALWWEVERIGFLKYRVEILSQTIFEDNRTIETARTVRATRRGARSTAMKLWDDTKFGLKLRGVEVETW